MYNLIIRFLKSIFLLIMSILKTLSSNYVPLLIVATILFYFITFLSQRKLILPCNNCENGSWYYKCARDTGFGTRTCKHYTFVTNTAEDLVNLLNNGTEKYIKIILVLLEHTSRVLKRYVFYIDDLIGSLASLFPPWLLFKFLVQPITKELYSSLKKANKKTSEFSCPFTLPIINAKIDICKLIISGVLLLLTLIELTFNTIVDIFGLIGKLIYLFVKTFIFDQLVKLIGASMQLITKNILSLLAKSAQLVTLIKKPINVILDIPITQYSILIIDSALNIIFDVIPGGQILRQAPAIILGTVILVLVITIVLPIIGGFIALFPLIKSLFYFIFGLDDDNDFKFLFNFIYKIMSKVTTLFN